MKNRTIVGFVAGISFIGVALCAIAYFYVFARYQGENPVRVSIPAGADVAAVDSIVENALGSSFGGKVMTMWKLQDGSPRLSHGSYLIKPGDEAVRVARRIAKGWQTPVRLTTACFRTRDDLAARVADVLEFDSRAFLNAADSIIALNGFEPRMMTAAFIPDTYEFYWTTSPDKVVDKMLAHRNAFWNSERRQKAEALGLTPVQVHTLASIANAETAQRDELGKVARLYLNRLNKNMLLQADPTVVFAGGDFSVRRVTRQMLDVESPYNTYKHRGLPPGPIGMVETYMIDSVLDSKPHNYLYMCAKSDFSGYHDFAETYDRHRINAARYHRALDSRGI